MASGQVDAPEEVDVNTENYLKTAARRAFERLKSGEDTKLDLVARFFSEELDKIETATDSQKDIKAYAAEMLEALEGANDTAADAVWSSIASCNEQEVREARERNNAFYQSYLMPILVETLSEMPENEREEILSKESDLQMEELLTRSRRAQIAMFGI